MQRWKLCQEDKCPRCQQPVENKLHITQCHAPKAQADWDTAIELLNGWLKSLKTEPNICHEITNRLRRWNQADDSQLTEHTSDAAKEQELLGWDLALKGCI